MLNESCVELPDKKKKKVSFDLLILFVLEQYPVFSGPKKEKKAMEKTPVHSHFSFNTFDTLNECCFLTNFQKVDYYSSSRVYYKQTTVFIQYAFVICVGA